MMQENLQVKRSLLIDLQLFPSVNYCRTLFQYSNIIFEQYEHYHKSGFSNRYCVSTPKGSLKLSVPLKGGRDQKTAIKDLRIADTEDWQKLHWRTLTSCYGRSPFFEFYGPILKPIFFKPYDFLIDLQLDAFSFLFRALKQKPEFTLSGVYEKTPSPSVEDVRHKALEEFAVPYPQNFESEIGFLPNLSVLDLIFNKGPQAFHHLSSIV
jgi:hypothetical protein